MRAADQPLVDAHTQWHVLSVPVNNPMVRIVRAGPSSMLWVSADDNIGVTATPPTVRWSSADDAAIEPTCSGLAHSAQAALLALGWARHGRWCHDLAPSGARCAKAAIAFQPFVT